MRTPYLERIGLVLPLMTLLASPASGQERDEAARPSATAGEVVAAIENARRVGPALKARGGRTVSAVEIVDVGTAIPEADRARVLAALEKRAADVETLRDEIDYSPLEPVERPGSDDVRLEAVLAERGVALEDVVGLKIEGETLVVYAYDRAVLTEDAAEL